MSTMSSFVEGNTTISLDDMASINFELTSFQIASPVSEDQQSVCETGSFCSEAVEEETVRDEGSCVKLHLELRNGSLYNYSSNKVWQKMSEPWKKEMEKALKQAQDEEMFAVPEITAGLNLEELVNLAEDLLSQKVTELQANTLRKHIPKLKKLVYLSVEDIECKGKVKNLWVNRPGDWPIDVMHVDPNNPGQIPGTKTQRPKPRLHDLRKMYIWLMKKYEQERQRLQNIVHRKKDPMLDGRVEGKSMIWTLQEEHAKVQEKLSKVLQIYPSQETKVHQIHRALSKDASDFDMDRQCAAIELQHKFLSDMDQVLIRHYNHMPIEEDTVSQKFASTLQEVKEKGLEEKTSTETGEVPGMYQIPIVIDQLSDTYGSPLPVKDIKSEVHSPSPIYALMTETHMSESHLSQQTGQQQDIYSRPLNPSPGKRVRSNPYRNALAHKKMKKIMEPLPDVTPVQHDIINSDVFTEETTWEILKGIKNGSFRAINMDSDLNDINEIIGRETQDYVGDPPNVNHDVMNGRSNPMWNSVGDVSAGKHIQLRSPPAQTINEPPQLLNVFYQSRSMTDDPSMVPETVMDDTSINIEFAEVEVETSSPVPL